MSFMSDGSPWIEKIELANIPDQLVSSLPSLYGYHVALDDYERFTIVSKVARGVHEESEVSVNPPSLLSMAARYS